MVLLHCLARFSQRNGWHLTVAHLNHQLRGRSSHADEQLVRRTARQLRVPLVIERGDVRGLVRKSGLSLEMAARQVRHEFLARTATRRNIKVIALAHHADDQLELFLLRLLRGSGGQGLAGMQSKSPSPLAPAIQLVRPFLKLPKAALQAYALEHNILYREDASNAALDILRNRVRHELLPLLKRCYQPALPQVIGRTAEILRSEAEFAQLAATKWLEQTRAQARASTRRGKPVVSFDELHPAVQRRAVQAQLLGLGIEPDYELVERLRSVPGAKVSARSGPFPAKKPMGSVFRDKSGVIHRVPGLAAEDVFLKDSLRSDLGGVSGFVRFGELRLRWNFSKGPLLGTLKSFRNKELFDADNVGTTVLLRYWRPGDRFQPIGMKKTVKLQDLFTNNRVPAAVRRKLVIATTADGEIFWVEGLRISERFKLTPKTIRRLHWAWERL